jgi:large subunit ribosomal protein L24e
MPEGKGRMFVRKSGQVLYFCSSKCLKNQKLGRQGKSRKWTAVSRKERGKD